MGRRLAAAAGACRGSGDGKTGGRVEDEAALRDAVLLTRPGDNVGPAGRMLLGWPRLAGAPAEKLLTEASIGAVMDDLGLARDDEGANELADDLRRCGASAGMVGMLTGAFAVAERHGFGRAVGAWLADQMLEHFR